VLGNAWLSVVLHDNRASRTRSIVPVEAVENAGSSEQRAVPRWCAPWCRVATCVVALGLSWWPVTFVLHIAVLVRWHPGAGIAISYGMPLMLLSWALGLGTALLRRGDPASVISERVVVILAVLPPALILLRVPVWLVSFA
jgi:hypothetical protein